MTKCAMFPMPMTCRAGDDLALTPDHHGPMRFCSDGYATTSVGNPVVHGDCRISHEGARGTEHEVRGRSKIYQHDIKNVRSALRLFHSTVYNVRTYWDRICLAGAPMGKGSLSGIRRPVSIVHCCSASKPRAVRQPVR